jgi:predicted O-methyltransferase YrrM
LKSAEKVLKKIQKIAQERFLPIVGPEKGKILAKVVRETKPKKVLEIGTLIGYSAILIARELSDDAHIVTIGINEDEAKMAKENLRKAEVAPKVDVIVGDALEVIPKLTGPFDLVFIDAEKTEYLQYLRLVEPKLHKGSVVVADNAGILAEEMRNYLDYVRHSPKYGSNYVSVGEDGLEISVRL